MTRVICVCSGKGGTGKTSIIANLGVALAQRQRKVVLIDADLLASSLSFYLGIKNFSKSLQDVLTQRADIFDALQVGPSGTFILPTDAYSLDATNFDALPSAIQLLEDKFDFVLIDAPAGFDQIAQTAIKVSHEILIVSLPTTVAITDAYKIKVLASNFGKNVIGVILNRVKKMPNEVSNEYVTKVLGLPLLEVIPEDKEMEISTSIEKPLILFRSNSPAAISIEKIVSNLLGERLRISWFTKLRSKLGF